jgi:hypothetical protein
MDCGGAGESTAPRSQSERPSSGSADACIREPMAGSSARWGAAGFGADAVGLGASRRTTALLAPRPLSRRSDWRPSNCAGQLRWASQRTIAFAQIRAYAARPLELRTGKMHMQIVDLARPLPSPASGDMEPRRNDRVDNGVASCRRGRERTRSSADALLPRCGNQPSRPRVMSWDRSRTLAMCDRALPARVTGRCWITPTPVTEPAVAALLEVG